MSAGDDQSHTVREYEVKERTDCRFEVNVDGEPGQAVSPLGWQENSEEFDDFYSYDHAHAHLDPSSGVIQRDHSYMFFYEYEDEVALVIVHDLPQEHGPTIDGSDTHSDIPAVGQPDYTYSGPSDTGGGAVDMVFDGLPSSGSWVLKDDAHDWTYVSPITGQACTAVSNRVCWSWSSRNTDGGIFAGGFEDPDNVDITVEANWNDPSVEGDTIGDGNYNAPLGGGQIDDDGWKFLYATEDGIKAIDLDKTKDVHIEGLESSP